MNIETRYQKALDYLYSFVDFSRTRQLHFDPTKMNLDKISALADLCGNPQQKYKVIHITGTKGKGSTAAMISSVLRKAGYKVGLYTSPHLIDFRERIAVDGKDISRTDLVKIIGSLKGKIKQVPELTTFDITTMVGFIYFAMQEVDFAVVEVGMGGKLDSTNIVDPLVSVITAISLDHTQVLGNTVEEIAENKAGIIKPGKPVVVSPQKPSVQKVIAAAAEKNGSKVRYVGQDIRFESISHSINGQEFTLKFEKEAKREFHIPLVGSHQIENAAAAYGALRAVEEAGYRITEEAYASGYAKVEWPGRFELLRSNPPIILDSAHNQDSTFRLAQTLQSELPGQQAVLLFGASEDKDIDSMFSQLKPYIRLVIASKSTHPRAMEPAEIVKTAKKYQLKTQIVDEVRNAFDIALVESDNKHPILVTGSMFIVAAVKEYWINEFAKRM